MTPNQPGVRVGPNDLQNTPVMTAVVAGTKGSAQATLNSLPNTSFLIQFFSSTTPDSSTYGQGQTLLGSQTVVTNASGNAMASVTPASAIVASSWVSATATNLVTGDTSEFAQDLTAQPVSVQFEMTQYSVLSSASTATIQVERTGNVSALVSVQYATSNGTAIAGKQYLAASGTLTFLPGQAYSEQTFPVTILPNGSQSGSTTTVNLTLSGPAGGATLGAISTATLSISELPAPPPPPPPPIDLIAPRLVSEQLIVDWPVDHGDRAELQQAAGCGAGAEPGELRLFRVPGWSKRHVRRRECKLHHAELGGLRERIPERDFDPERSVVA